MAQRKRNFPHVVLEVEEAERTFQVHRANERHFQQPQHFPEKTAGNQRVDYDWEESRLGRRI